METDEAFLVLEINHKLSAFQFQLMNSFKENNEKMHRNAFYKTFSRRTVFSHCFLCFSIWDSRTWISRTRRGQTNQSQHPCMFNTNTFHFSEDTDCPCLAYSNVSGRSFGARRGEGRICLARRKRETQGHSCGQSQVQRPIVCGEMMISSQGKHAIPLHPSVSNSGCCYFCPAVPLIFSGHGAFLLEMIIFNGFCT